MYDYRRQRGGPIAQLVGAIKFLAESGVPVINVSAGINWRASVSSGGQGHAPGDSLADSLTQRGVYALLRDELLRQDSLGINPLIVISAGNDHVNAWWNGTASVRQDFPRRVIVVAAFDSINSRLVTGALASFSDTGNLVDVAAPGVAVYSLANSLTPVADSGTSLLVTGIAGLIWSTNPLLTPDSVKALVLAGANRDGRRMGGVPVANAYLSLRTAAEAPGAPLCGNRLWPQGNQIMVQRTATLVEPLITASGPVISVTAMHGGKRVLYQSNAGAGAASYSAGAWTNGQQLPGDTLFAGVTTAMSHNGDSVAAIIGGGGTQPIILGVRPVTRSTWTTIPGSLPANVSGSGPTLCMMTDSMVCAASGQFNSGLLDSPWSADLAPESSIGVSFSSKGDELYISYSANRVILADTIGSHVCAGSPGYIRCMQASVTRAIASGAVYAVNIKTGAQRILAQETGTGVWGGVADEYSSQIAYPVGTWQYSFEYSMDNFWNLGIPANGGGNPCVQKYLPLTVSAPPGRSIQLSGNCLSPQGFGVIAPIRALAVLNADPGRLHPGGGH